MATNELIPVKCDICGDEQELSFDDAMEWTLHHGVPVCGERQF